MFIVPALPGLCGVWAFSFWAGFPAQGLGFGLVDLGGLRWLCLAPFFLGEDDISFLAFHPGDLKGFLQGVDLDDLVIFFAHGDGFARFGHLFPHGVVGVVLVGEAAEQPVADAGDLGRIERQPLLLCHLDGNRGKVLEIGRAAELSAAAAQAADHLGFVANPDLADFHPGAEFLNQILDQLAKIHPGVGGEIEDDLAAVQEPLHLDELHGQAVGVDEAGADAKSLPFAFKEAGEFFCLVPGSPPDDEVRAQALRRGASWAGQGPGMDCGRLQAVLGLGHDQLIDLEILDAGDGGEKLVSWPKLNGVAGFRRVVLVFVYQLFSRRCFRGFVHVSRSNSPLAAKIVMFSECKYSAVPLCGCNICEKEVCEVCCCT